MFEGNMLKKLLLLSSFILCVPGSSGLTDFVNIDFNLAKSICKAVKTKDFNGIVGRKAEDYLDAAPCAYLVKVPCADDCTSAFTKKQCVEAALPDERSGDPTIANEAEPYVIKHVVSIQERTPEGNNTFRHLAAGVIYRRSKIVTLGDVVNIIQKNGKENYRVVAGIHHLDKDEITQVAQFRDVWDVAVHSNYGDPESNIGMIRVRPSFALTNRVAKSVFGDEADMKYILQDGPEKYCQVYGWGGCNNRFLQNRTVEMADDFRCKTAVPQGTWYVKTPDILCFGNRISAPCFGDEGSPLMCTMPDVTINGARMPKVMGLVSWIKACGSEDEPALIQNTFMKRILRFIQEGKFNGQKD